jgi:tetratricopeptide (TPR) repeat protein
MIGLSQRGVGFNQGVRWWHYGLTSCRSVLLYFKLAVWPHPLVLDYGPDFIQHLINVIPYTLIFIAFASAITIALWRWPARGFVGAWFLVILVPTSSVVPVAGQPMAEHRMYLSLAAVVTAGVLALYTLIGRRSIIVFAAAVTGLGWLSILRNEDYRSGLTIWRDTVAKCPGNARAHFNLAATLMSLGRSQEAIAEYETALQIQPDYEEAHNNLGLILSNIPGRSPEAISHYEAALRIKPNCAEAHNNLGLILSNIPGRSPEAISHYEAALRINPDYIAAHYNLARMLANTPGRLPEAILQYETIQKIDPRLVEPYFNLGNVWLQQGRYSAACQEYKESLELNPGFVEGYINLGIALAKMGLLKDAIAQFEIAQKIKPDDPSAQKEKERVENMLLNNHREDPAGRPAP